MLIVKHLILYYQSQSPKKWIFNTASFVSTKKKHLKQPLISCILSARSIYAAFSYLKNDLKNRNTELGFRADAYALFSNYTQISDCCYHRSNSNYDTLFNVKRQIFKQFYLECTLLLPLCTPSSFISLHNCWFCIVVCLFFFFIGVCWFCKRGSQFLF